jgi:hypothetical protein
MTPRARASSQSFPISVSKMTGTGLLGTGLLGTALLGGWLKEVFGRRQSESSSPPSRPAANRKFCKERGKRRQERGMAERFIVGRLRNNAENTDG